MYSLVIVDDEDFCCVAIRNFVMKMHPEYSRIKTFANGADAWAYVQQEGADVLITDIRMPGLDGLELARLVYEQAPETAVIIISSYNEFEYARKAIQYRPVDYLLKPLDYRELSGCFRKIAEGRAPKEEPTAPDSNPEETTNGQFFVDRAIEQINLRYGQPLTREALAEQLYLSPSYFSRIFKQYTGESFSDYLRKVRLEKACQLLSGRHKIKDIARQVGYQSLNRFLINFQKQYGCTPSEWRLKHCSPEKKQK